MKNETENKELNKRALAAERRIDKLRVEILCIQSAFLMDRGWNRTLTGWTKIFTYYDSNGDAVEHASRILPREAAFDLQLHYDILTEEKQNGGQ